MVKLADFNTRVIVKRWGYTETATGGLKPTLLAQWEKWAKVENRSGGLRTAADAREWNYTYKITLKYEKGRVERVGNTVDYDGRTLQIENISILDEGSKTYNVLRCSTVDELGTQQAAPVQNGFPYTLNLKLA